MSLPDKKQPASQALPRPDGIISLKSLKRREQPIRPKLAAQHGDPWQSAHLPKPMTCPWCSYDNLPPAKFCGDCGRSLLADAVCDSCATRNPVGHRFCDACGAPFADPGPLPTAPTPSRPAAAAAIPRPQWIGSMSDGLAQARARLEKLGLYGWEAAALIASSSWRWCCAWYRLRASRQTCLPTRRTTSRSSTTSWPTPALVSSESTGRNHRPSACIW